MNSTLIYQYPTLIPGRLVKRYKRFFADIELASGEIVTAHCPNTGPMTGVCTPGSWVQVSRDNNPKRKLSYTWEMILVNDTSPTWVGINTALPNRIMKTILEKKLFPELFKDYNLVSSEVPYGTEKKSRIDFVLSGEGSAGPIYLEIKNVTLARGNVALFPDTVTTRGQKHLRELMGLLQPAQPVMLYFINRGDCSYFAPGDTTDRVYGQLLREAIDKGVKILPCRFQVTPQCVYYLGLAEFLPYQPQN